MEDGGGLGPATAQMVQGGWSKKTRNFALSSNLVKELPLRAGWANDGALMAFLAGARPRGQRALCWSKTTSCVGRRAGPGFGVAW